MSGVKYPGVRALFAEVYGDFPDIGKQQELADAADVSAATVSRWFAGETRITRKRWSDVAACLGVSYERVERAWTGAAVPPTVLPIVDDGLDERVSRLKSGQEDLRQAVELLLQAVVTSEPLRIEIEALLARANGADPERTAARRRAR